MPNNEPFEFEVTITSLMESSENLDDLTRSLYIELQDFNLEKIELKKGSVLPKGAKSVTDPITIGAITIAVLPTLLPKVIEFIQDWSMRGEKKSIKFKGKIAGDIIEFEGSPEELQKMISRIQRLKK